MKINSETERVIDPKTTEYHGCGDHRCRVRKPMGQATSTGCRCHKDERTAMAAIDFMADKIMSLEIDGNMLIRETKKQRQKFFQKIREYEAMEKIHNIQAIKIPDSNGLLVVTVENPSDIENICMDLPRFIDRIAPGIKFLVKNDEITIESLDEKAMEAAGWIRKEKAFCLTCQLFDKYFHEDPADDSDEKYPDNCCRFLCNCGSCPHDAEIKKAGGDARGGVAAEDVGDVPVEDHMLKK
jgi:hypothetical protein